MDKKTFDETAKRLKEANQVLAKLDPAIREDAWGVLKPYVTGRPGAASPGGARGGGGSGAGNGGGGSGGGGGEGPDIRALLDEHATDDNPTENGLLVAAILYATYGDGPYEPKELTAIGEEHRLRMPILHNFLPRTKREEKKVFRKTKGGWVITLDGAKWLQATYGVTRGTQEKPE